MNEKDFENENSELYQTLKQYFKYNKYESKCMHDLVAFLLFLMILLLNLKKLI